HRLADRAGDRRGNCAGTDGAGQPRQDAVAPPPPYSDGDRAAMRFAVLPAGGKSVRMGRPKLSLPLRGRTVLECVVTALREGGIERVLVVVGPHVAELCPLAEAVGARVCLLPAETPDMRATVEIGLTAIEQRW